MRAPGAQELRHCALIRKAIEPGGSSIGRGGHVTERQRSGKYLNQESFHGACQDETIVMFSGTTTATKEGSGSSWRARQREGRAPKRAQVPAFGVRPPLERPRGQHSALLGCMLTASCFRRISIRFRGPVSSIQALNRGPSRRERIARGTLCAATYFSACAGYLGHIGTKVRALDRAATRRVNTTPPLRSRYLSCFCSRSTWRSSSFLLLTHQKQQWSK